MGGNGAIGGSHILYQNVSRPADAVMLLTKAQSDFATRSHSTLDKALAARRWAQGKS